MIDFDEAVERKRNEYTMPHFAAVRHRIKITIDSARGPPTCEVSADE
jgi:hypothetical protein